MARESDLQLASGSPVWQLVLDHLAERLDMLRRDNDHVASEAETAWRRGRIAELKHLQEAFSQQGGSNGN